MEPTILTLALAGVMEAKTWGAIRAEEKKTTSSHRLLQTSSALAVTGGGGGDHVRIMKLTPPWAEEPAHTVSSCSGSTAGCWWCGYSSGLDFVCRVRRTEPSTAENHPYSEGVAAARPPFSWIINKLRFPECNTEEPGEAVQKRRSRVLESRARFRSFLLKPQCIWKYRVFFFFFK